MSLRCPACEARNRRSVTELLCPPCWRKVPDDLRSAVWRAWRSFKRGEVTYGELRGKQQEAIDAVRVVPA